MDLRALINKMDAIGGKQNLTESDDRKPAKKQEREVELPSGAKVKATKVQGWQSQKGDKEADKERKKNDESVSFKSSIANALLKEFGYVNEGPLDDLQAWHKKNSDAVAAKQTADAQATKDMADPAAQAKIKAGLSPEQLKWLGGANPADPIIMSRLKAAVPDAPKAGQAASPVATPKPQVGGATTQDMGDGSKMTTGPDGKVAATDSDGNPYIPGSNPELARIKKLSGQAASPAAAAPTGTTAQGDDEGNTMITKPDGSTMVVGPDGNAIKPGTNPALATNKAQAAALASGAQDDATGVDAAVAAQAAAGPGKAPATQAASPAKKPAGTPDPKVMAMQQDLIKKGAKIKADGIMGPATQAAQKQFGGGQAASPAAGATGAAAVPASADKSKPFWVNGTRFEFKAGRGGSGWQQTATPGDTLQWNSTRARSSSNYTGADDAFPGAAQAQAKAPAPGQAASPAKPKQNASTEFNDPAIQEQLQAMLRIAGLR
jgi:hypothetical protein